MYDNSTYQIEDNVNLVLTGRIEYEFSCINYVTFRIRSQGVDLRNITEFDCIATVRFHDINEERRHFRFVIHVENQDPVYALVHATMCHLQRDPLIRRKERHRSPDTREVLSHWTSSSPDYLNFNVRWDMNRNGAFSSQSLKKAKELLVGNLTDYQLECYSEEGYFYVTGNVTGNEYLIEPKEQMNIILVDYNRDRVSRHCVTPFTRIPVADHQLAIKLMIENNEQLFWDNQIEWNL